MKRKLKLCDLCDSEGGYISEMHVKSPLRRRLLDIGLTENTFVQCVGKSPAGDPAAYEFRGSVFAVRAADAANIIIEKEKPGEADIYE